MLSLYGAPVYFSSFLSEHRQARFPRSKKKRIRKKWARRPENWREFPRREVYIVGGSLVVHPDFWKELCRKFEADPGGTLHARCPDVARRIRRLYGLDHGPFTTRFDKTWQGEPR